MSMEYAPGMRLNIRGEEWLLRNVVTTKHGTCRLDVIGLSPMVRDREAVFMADLEESLPERWGRIQILDPRETEPMRDDSPYFRNARLHLEVLMRQTAPSDALIHRGHKAAIDVLPFQLKPAFTALEQPRQRILIADAVGLGKTIECGILLSELIKRGRARRILVLTGKSMLKQFMKELWNRFSIPLVRLDSAGIARIRREIPSNQNPFSYYDKTIISIDTLKQAGTYRRFLEDSHWEVIVIDEAHNIAARGKSMSQRANLAESLANKCDSLILLSATPHDGRKESFASIIKLLDPTAISNVQDYKKEDVRALFIRRFKKDVRDQLSKEFPERVQYNHVVNPSDAEVAMYRELTALELDMDKDGAKKQSTGVTMLFKTMIGKTLASSPEACVSLLSTRLANLEKKQPGSADIPKLQRLRSLAESITPESFSKYTELVRLLSRGGDMQWTRGAEDRVVIFTESIPTLNFLTRHLPAALGLKDKEVRTMHGGMTDVEQMEIIEEFGKAASPVRLLLVSDVGSEGVNLHHCAHRLIHFDIPWSLLTFQQRNGRIDRYGQTQQPRIDYLFTENSSYGIAGDARILVRLIAKDAQVQQNIGDPREFRLYNMADDADDIVQEATLFAGIMESSNPEDRLEEALSVDNSEVDDFWSLFDAPAPAPVVEEQHTVEDPSLYPSDFDFVAELCEFARKKDARFSYKRHDEAPRSLELEVSKEFYKARVKRQFPGCYAEGDKWELCEDVRDVMQAVNRVQKGATDAEWPTAHRLWEQDPMVEWLSSKVTAEFGRNTAPVITTTRLKPTERIVLGLATVTNRRGVPVEQIWRAILFDGETKVSIMTLQECFDKCDLFAGGTLPNTGAAFDAAAFKRIIPTAVAELTHMARESAAAFEQEKRAQLQEQTDRLNTYQSETQTYLEGFYQASNTQKRKEAELEKVRATKADHERFIRESLTTADHPSVRIITLFAGATV